jgi:hypothetical protein
LLAGTIWPELAMSDPAWGLTEAGRIANLFHLELVAKPHKRFMMIMIQAIWRKASYMQTWCSYRTTMRRKFPNQLNVRSTVYRLL